ncbi:MAG: DUF4147 domain-containing protein, partial [Anaerolineales bacterium]|nr:DUF4147 domain-containing protein [Anaerolineales bacterium]
EGAPPLPLGEGRGVREHLHIQPGGHPIPDQNSLLAGQKARAFVSGLTECDLLICLISGGGSALMSAPRQGISLDELQQLTRSLLACGARIDEINILRRHLDELKGGGLARLAAPARVVSLILSDVVGNSLETIASGPTAPDPSTRADALMVLQKYGLTKSISPAILQTLQNAPETPKPGEPLFARVQNVIAGSNRLAAEAALEQAICEGFHAHFLGDDWQGEAREIARRLCAFLHFIPFARQSRGEGTPPLPLGEGRGEGTPPLPLGEGRGEGAPPLPLGEGRGEGALPLPLGEGTGVRANFCLIAGGETTVTLRGNGRGGRNQELALAAVRELSQFSGSLLITLATDGEDGPTDAAGAVVSPETFARGLELGLDPDLFLENNDSYTYFSALDDLIKIGPTGTNVNDLTFLFFASKDRPGASCKIA